VSTPKHTAFGGPIVPPARHARPASWRPTFASLASYPLAPGGTASHLQFLEKALPQRLPCWDRYGMDPSGTDASATENRGGVEDRPRVVVAEDDTLLREGLASLLERSGFEVVGQAGDAVELLALVREKSPELVVVDIRMPPTNTTEGLQAAHQIRIEFPDIGILVLSAHVEVEHAMELLQSGHKVGYLLKSRVEDLADFIESLRRISRGGSVIDPELVKELVSERRRHDPLAVLSTREREVLSLMAEGRSNAGIGRQLWVTEGTIEKHVSSILTKLNLPETANDHRRVRAVIAFLEAPPASREAATSPSAER
jgi:DNA-binding NarL/FixJ family response regulator